MSLYSNISEVLNKQGMNVPIGTIYDQIPLWKSWFRGNVDNFHNYTITVAGSKKNKELKTMNMAKKVCEDFRKLLWTEKTKITLSNVGASKKLWQILDNKENSFSVNFPNFIEKAFALGTGALIEYKNNEGRLIIDYIYADVIIPFEYNNSYIKGLITISRDTKKERGTKIYNTVLTFHKFDGATYTKWSELYKSKNESELGRKLEFEAVYPDVENPYTVETPFPHFQILKPNIVNNYDLDSPMGISIFANSIDRLKAIDEKYDSFSREFRLGKRRIVVDSTFLKGRMEADEEGNTKLVQYFDSDDETFIAVNGNENQPIKDIDFALRTDEHINAINAELNWLSSGIGLGSNYYKFDGVSIKTAKEVMSENSEAFRTKEHHAILVNDVVYDLVYAICELEGITTKTITIKSDDSIIEDKDTEQLRAMSEVSQGLRSKSNYLTEVRGLSESEATTELDKIQTERNVTDIFVEE